MVPGPWPLTKSGFRLRRPHNENSFTSGDGPEPGQVHRLSHLLDHLQERLDQPRRHGIRLVQQRRDQARDRLPQGVGKPGQVEGRLGAQQGRFDQPAHRRQVPRAGEYLRQPGYAEHRRLLRAVRLRLPEPAHRAPGRAPAGGPAALGDQRQAHGEDRVGPQLGGNPRHRVRQAPQGQELRRGAGRYLRPVREHLHDVPAAPVRALPQPGVRGLLPERGDLQARGRWHRPDRSGEVPRLAHVHQRLPVQEDLLQLEERQIREVHLLLPAYRSRHAHRVLGNLRGPHPLPGRAAV